VYRKQVRRRRAVLALLVIGGFVLLTVTYGRGSTSLQEGVSSIFSPVESVADRALKPARDLINWFDKTFDARGENSELKTELEATREQAVGAQAAIAENRELRKLLELDESGDIPGGYTPVTGRVIVRSPTEWTADVIVDVGTGDGVAVGNPVVNGDGLVGAVTAASGSSAKVTLITDNSSAVTARVVPGGSQGVIKPSLGDPGSLTLDFIRSSKLIGRNRIVVTAGWSSGDINSGYPPNLPIGEVVEASPIEQEAQQQVHVKPFADLRNLDFLQVLTGGWRE
jgi:rod shape-determining protein MreC